MGTYGACRLGRVRVRARVRMYIFFFGKLDIYMLDAPLFL